MDFFNKIQVKSFYSKKGVLENSFGLSTVTESAVYKLISTVNTKKATGLDGISAKFIRDGCSVIASPITHILNLSLSQSTVPNAFKEARVVPLYKKGGRGEVGNYRPVSILPVVSKIFERIVYDQLSKHLDKHNILYKYQSGFRKSYSTETALIDLSDRIKFSMDNGLYTGMVMIDLQKAFDTVNHAIMSDKLGAIGCDDGSVKWFNSYLSNRSQYIDIKGTLSDRGEVTCGIPQGSILGPLLFLIYVNDMESAVDCDLLLYADDSALLIRGKNIIDIEQKLSEELNKLNVWLIDNKLSLHLGKTESILFASNRKLKQHKFLRISCNGINVGGKEVVTYLGGQLDQDLSGKSMAQKIINKANASLKFVYRKKIFLNQYCGKTVCMAMIQSRIDYASNFYYHSLPKFLQSRLQVVQNKMIRYVLNYSNRTHLVANDFNEVKWMSIENRKKYLATRHVFNCINEQAPEYLLVFERVNESHHYNTRHSVNALILPKVGSHGIKSFHYIGAKIWNSLPDEIQTTFSKSLFKVRCKKHFMSVLSES